MKKLLRNISLKIKIFFIRFFLKKIITNLIPKNKSSIYYWKEYFFNVVSFIFLFFLTIFCLILFTYKIINGNFTFLIFGSILYLTGIVVAFFRKIPYIIRSYLFCSIFLIIGIIIFYKVGPISGGLFWIFVFSILCAAYDGIRGAVISNIIIIIVVGIFMYLIATRNLGWIYINDDLYFNYKWFQTGINIVFISIVISFVIAFFINNLEKSLKMNSDSKNAIIIGLASLTEYRDVDYRKAFGTD